MSELRSDSPVQRPDTARPRDGAASRVDPLAPHELAAIHRHLVTLPGQEGASVVEDVELGVTFVRGPGSGPDLTYAALPHWDQATWRERLDALRGRMLEQDTWPSLLLSDRLEHPPGLPDELARQGWLPVTSETVMWVGQATVVPHLDRSLRVEAVQPRSLETHQRLERRIFGIRPDQAERRRAALAAALEAGRLRAWVVWAADEPVAVARLSQGDGVAGLQGIGVVEAHRRGGYGTLITTIATRAGLATGNRVVWLSVRDDNDAAVGVYRRLGYGRAFRWTRWLMTEDPRRR